MAIDEAAVKDVAMQAAVLVLVFGYADGGAAIEEALTMALGSESADPADIAAVQAYLAAPSGLAAVEAYVAATFRDLGPVGVAIGGVADRLRERFRA